MPSMRRPVVLTVLGSLNLLLAVPGLLGDLKAVAGLVSRLVTATSPAASEPAQNPAHVAVFAALMLSAVAATIVLAAAGVGLLRSRPWGRSLSIGYALYALVATPLTIALQYFWVCVPAVQRAAAVSPKLEQLVSTQVIRQMAAAVSGGLMGLAYAAILLWFMFHPGVTAALARAAAAHARAPFRSSA
jgi:hypothetical protein